MQADCLLNSEHERWLRDGAERYEPSLLTSAVLASVAARSSAVFTTGLVGLALWGMSALGVRPSLTKAHHGVANALADQHKTPFYYWDASQKKYFERRIDLPSSERAVREAFNQHRRAVHICAARVVANEYLEPLAPFDPAPIAQTSYVLTAAALMGFFARYDEKFGHANSRPINPYLFGWHSGFQPNIPALEPTKGLMQPLMAACGYTNLPSG